MILKVIIIAAGLTAMSSNFARADNGLITKPSKYSVTDTIEKFESAIKAHAANGWVVFNRIDHAAAAKAAGLEMRPRTVIIYGNPRNGTALMTKTATLAIDLPMKVLVWQDDQDKVWLTYNSSEYGATAIYPRHGLAIPDDSVEGFGKFLDEATNQSTR